MRRSRQQAMVKASEQLAELFAELSPLPPDERGRRLEVIAQDAPGLAADLHSLLAAHNTAGDFLEHLDTGRAGALLADDDRWSVPAMAGPFRLVREIGRGGLGVVYLGERAGGEFEQVVAVKLIKRGMDSDQIVRRFHAERRILAALEHPNISRLIDGGMLDDGRPWFAMEYIRGLPLTEWCRQRKLTLGERLELFEQVCRTVQYAHARLIVHRDLKPANILVTARDSKIPSPPSRGRGLERGGTDVSNAPSPSLPRERGRRPSWKDTGEPKLLDFGIAKLLDQEDGATALTGAGMLAMSRDYAAPEQIRGEPVSVATDVHALGVVLYELLTGVHPFRRAGQSRTELTRAICETEPNHPSAVVNRENRQGALSTRQLRGDLDTIILTAMAKRPERRYGSADALAEDLRRSRDKLPIRARRKSGWYRATRFVRRHRVGFGATAAVMLALLAGLVVAAWQARRASEEAELARNHAARAELAASRWRRSLDFLTELFRGGDPRYGDPVDSIEELLDVGTERAREDLAGDPNLQAQVFLRLGEVRYNRADYQLAGELAGDALELLEPNSQDSREQLAQAYYLAGRVHYQFDRTEQARRFLQQAIDLYEVLADVDGLAEARSILAGNLRRSDDFEQAVALQRRILAETETRLGAEHPRTVEHRYSLVVFAIDLGDYQLAERELRAAIRAMEQADADMRVDLSSAVLTLASLLDRVGRNDESGALFERGISIRNELFGAESAPVADARFSFGIYLLGQDLPERAETEFRAVIDAADAAPSTHAHGWRYLGRALRDQGAMDDAIVAFETAEAAYQNIGGTSMVLQAHRAAADRGHALALDGRLTAAIPVLESAVAGIEAIRGTSHYDLIQPLGYLGEALARMGMDAPAAAATLERAARMAEALLGPGHRFTVEAKSRLIARSGR